MIFAETSRLVLRQLEKSELPRLVELLDIWDIVRWLVVVPYPYSMQDAEDFYAESELAVSMGEPQFYTMALKSNNLLIGGVGLHSPRNKNASEGDIEIGYWLGQAFWGKGLMTEAARAVVSLGFARPATRALVATTALNNVASQNVLLKIGMRNQGESDRDYKALRGDDRVLRWKMTREEWQKNGTSGFST